MSIRIKVKPKGAYDTSESTKNVGSAKVLVGRIHVLSVFVGPRSAPWHSTDVERQKKKVFEAENWLKAQAARFGKRVEFVNTAYGSDGTFVDYEIPQQYDSDETQYLYPSRVLLKMGFRSKDAYVEWVRTHFGCPQCLVMVFSNTKGRSYAAPSTKELFAYDPHNFNLECCFLYRYHMNTGIETNAASIAHEMLHLFGAWDLYEDNPYHARAAKTTQMFPNSIMLNISDNIWELQIDEINAWLVGLKETGKDWYRWFEPDQETYESA